MTQPDTPPWPVCTRDGGLHALRYAGASTYGLDQGKLIIIAGLKDERVYLELNGGGYRTLCCPARAAQEVDTCDCIDKYLILDLVWYFSKHLDDFHANWQAWLAQQWDGDTDTWFAQDGLWATIPSTYPGDIAVICYAGQWLRTRVHGDLMSAHGGGPDRYRVTFGWEPQLLNTVWPYVTGFAPPATDAAPAGTLTATAGT